MTGPKTFLTYFLCVAALSLTSFGQVAKDRGTIKIKSTVIAEYRMLAHACYHVCGLTLIVKLDKFEPAKYVVVQVDYMDVHSAPRNGMPMQLLEKASRWKFQAVLEDSRGIPLQKYMTFIDQNGKDVSEETAILAWDLLKGAENEKLPFGESLLGYSVKVGKFKSIK